MRLGVLISRQLSTQLLNFYFIPISCWLFLHRTLLFSVFFHIYYLHLGSSSYSVKIQALLSFQISCKVRTAAFYPCRQQQKQPNWDLFCLHQHYIEDQFSLWPTLFCILIEQFTGLQLKANSLLSIILYFFWIISLQEIAESSSIKFPYFVQEYSSFK